MAGTTTCFPRRLPLVTIFGAIFGCSFAHQATATTLQVTDCSDGAGAGTLRNTVAAAASGDTVQIPLTCSKITLTQGEIEVVQAITNLTIAGQGESLTTIDGGSFEFNAYYQRVFVFASTTSGTMTLQNMTITHATPPSSYPPAGGCIGSSPSDTLFLSHVTVSHCELNPISGKGISKGAAIYAEGDLTLADSTITDNVAFARSGYSSKGAGVYVRGDLMVIDSTISNNVAVRGASGAASRAGGIYALAQGSVFVIDSTISGNRADENSAMQVGNGTSSSNLLDFISSTVANNTANSFQAIGSYVPTYLTNTTIAFNHTLTSGSGSPAGLYCRQTIVANNSILADNSQAGIANNDVHSTVGISGSNNLITATTNSVPLGTLNACPKLGPLTNNGGETLTLPLLAGSPALDVGAPNGQTTDQRGTGFPRTVGAGTDIGAYERQAGVVDDVIFFGEFESTCN